MGNIDSENKKEVKDVESVVNEEIAAKNTASNQNMVKIVEVGKKADNKKQKSKEKVDKSSIEVKDESDSSADNFVENKDKLEDSKRKKSKEVKPAKRAPSGSKIVLTILSVLLAAIAVLLYFGTLDSYIQPYFDLSIIEPYRAIIPLVAQFVLAIIVILSAPSKKLVAPVKAAEEPEQKIEEKHDEDPMLVPIPNIMPAPVTRPEEPVAPINFDKYNRTDLEEINGGLYSEIVKFNEKIRILEKLGATDLDIIQTNMSGSTEFDEILKAPRNQRTLSAADICSYAMSKPSTVVIKKRGAINWTFKYGAKSFLIVREGKDGYKVSVKCFPDAAVKLNEVYKALEDSNFPSGPIWFCWSELRNLPPTVVKWLIDTAYQIGVLQQTKTDKLRDPKTFADYDIDGVEIKAQYSLGQNIIKLNKFTLVFQKGAAADLGCLLIRPPKNFDTSKYIKELYYKFKFNPELSVTLLPNKGVSEDMINTFFENIEETLLTAPKRKADASDNIEFEADTSSKKDDIE